MPNQKSTETVVLICTKCGQEFFTDRLDRKRCRACIDLAKKQISKKKLNLDYNQKKIYAYKPLQDVIAPNATNGVLTLNDYNAAMEIFDRNKRKFLEEISLERELDELINPELYLSCDFEEEISSEFI